MCDKCEELKTQIDRARRFLSGGLDAVTRGRIEHLLQDLETEHRKQVAACQTE
jgi:hypothetical protein